MKTLLTTISVVLTIATLTPIAVHADEYNTRQARSYIRDAEYQMRKPRITDAMPIRIDAPPKATVDKWTRTLNAMTHAMPKPTGVECKTTLTAPQIMIVRLYKPIVELPII